jgi:cytochrome o ubiquinol oxidase subunit 3
MNHITLHNHHLEADARTVFGFWIYIMSDCFLFAALFIVYAVLHNNTFGGLSAHDIFNLPFVLVETLILLSSSFTYGLTMLAVHRHRKNTALVLIAITILLGLSFVSLEITEFSHLLADGTSWTRSGFLSAFFTLVGTHALHVSLGLLWMFSLMIQIVDRGLTPHILRKLTALGIFWHFLDIIWIFVFTIVYLLGAL